MRITPVAGALALAYPLLFSHLATAEELPLYSLPEIVVTPDRFAGPGGTAPVGATVITSAEIERSPARSLPDLLANIAGVVMRDNSGGPDKQIDLRGFGINGPQNTLVLLDGQRLSEIELVSPKLSAIPLAAIDRIEIVRGAGSVIYGGGATGGAINIVTRRASSGVEGGVSAGYGSFDTTTASAHVAAGGERFGASLYADTLHSNNWREHNAVAQDNVLADFRWGDAASGVSLKLGADRQKLELPGSRTEAQLQTDPRGTATPFDDSRRSGSEALLGGRHRIGALDLAVDAAFRERNAAANFVSFGFTSATDVDHRGLYPRASLALDAARAHVLTVGADWEHWGYASESNFGINLARENQRGIYVVQDSRWAEGFALSLGGRIQDVEQQVGSPSPPAYQDRTLKAWHLNLSQALSPKTTLFGKVGRSFRVATVDENLFLPTLLEPQTSQDYEIGAEWRFRGHKVRGALFRHDIDNEIAFQPAILVPPFGSNINLPPTRRQGAELEATVHEFADHTFTVGLAWLDATFRSAVLNGIDVSGNEVPLAPKANASLGWVWEVARNTRLTSSVRYVGEQRFDNDNANTFSRKMPDYTLLDMKLARRIGDWSLSLSGNNLLDEEYFSYGIVSGASYSAYPQTGRSFMFQVAYRMKGS
jgi:iron complex outermembrane receptor protein